MDLHAMQERMGWDNVRVIVDRPKVTVCRVEKQGQPMLLKFHDVATKVVREVESITALSRKGGAVPKILGTGEYEGRAYFLQEWWEGVPMLEVYAELSRSEQLLLLREAGKFLANWQMLLTEQDLEAMTWWREPGKDETLATDYRWKEQIAYECRVWSARIRLTKEDRALGVDRLLAKTEAALDRIEEPSRLALLHYDYCMRNLMLTPERDAIRGLFDFEAVRFGDALYDAVKLTFNEIPDDPEGCRAYLEGYIEAGGHPMDWERFRLYQAINGIGAMAWVDKWEEEFASRHQEFREKGRRVLVESMSG